MNVLVLAPHPDDEVIGVGGTIINHVRSGDKVFLVIFTRAHEPFWSESTINKKNVEVNAVVNFLGISKLFWFEFKTASLNTVEAIDISSKIEDIIEQTTPDIIYSPPKGDLHLDHDIVAKQALSASRKAKSLKKFIFYEEPQNTQDNSNLDYFIPNYFVDISKSIDKKISALNKYLTEKKKFPHPRSAKSLKMAAKYRGLAIGVKYAEAFMLVREIIR